MDLPPKRQLTLEELSHALAVEPEDEDLDLDNFISTQFLLECCLGLVVFDESIASVRLVHKSLQDYLTTQYTKGALFQEGHFEIARICLTYISFEIPVVNPRHLKSDRDMTLSSTRGILKKYVLLNYATINWAHHSRNAKSMNNMEDVIFAFFRDQNNDTASKSLFSWPIVDACSDDILYEWRYWITVALANRFPELPGEISGRFERVASYSPLHNLAYCGFDIALRLFIEYSKVDIDRLDLSKRSSMSYAAGQGHTKALEVLLEKGAKVDLECDGNKTPLAFAARGGTCRGSTMALSTWH